MGLKCFFGHMWKEEKRRAEEVFEDENDRIPLFYQTKFLYKCTRCEKLKVIILIGKWDKDNEDDDDDDNFPLNPQMSPDDFYEMITKENK